MDPKKNVSLLVAVMLALALSGCPQKSTPPPEETATPAAPPGTIPITSKSPEAVEKFKEGRELYENIRFSEAKAELEAALRLDTTFAQAYAYLAYLELGSAAVEYRERAKRIAPQLPETERLFVEASMAAHEGDLDKEGKAVEALLQKMDKNWRVQWLASAYYTRTGETEKSIQALEQTTTINQKAAPAFNTLAYAYAQEGRLDDALEAVDKYVALIPSEPNPHDTKGDMLLQAGKFAEAEAAYGKALEIDANFVYAHDGIAATRFYRNDWKGGIEALNAGLNVAKGTPQRFDFQQALAFAHLASAKQSQAIAIVNGPLAETIKGAGMAEGWVAFERGRLHQRAGQWTKANAEMKAGWDSIEAQPSAAYRKRLAASRHAAVAARAGDLATAEARLAFLEDGNTLDGFSSYARAHVAWASGEIDEAVEMLLANSQFDFALSSRLAAADALSESGKHAEAKKLYEALATSNYNRSLDSVLIWQQASKKAGKRSTAKR